MPVSSRRQDEERHCFLCGEEDERTVSCNNCMKLYCLNCIKKECVPPENWYCPICKPGRTQKAPEKDNTKKREGAAIMERTMKALIEQQKELLKLFEKGSDRSSTKSGARASKMETQEQRRMKRVHTETLARNKQISQTHSNTERSPGVRESGFDILPVLTNFQQPLIPQQQKSPGQISGAGNPEPLGKQQKAPLQLFEKGSDRSSVKSRDHASADVESAGNRKVEEQVRVERTRALLERGGGPTVHINTEVRRSGFHAIPVLAPQNNGCVVQKEIITKENNGDQEKEFFEIDKILIENENKSSNETKEDYLGELNLKIDQKEEVKFNTLEELFDQLTNKRPNLTPEKVETFSTWEESIIQIGQIKSTPSNLTPQANNNLQVLSDGYSNVTANVQNKSNSLAEIDKEKIEEIAIEKDAKETETLNEETKDDFIPVDQEKNIKEERPTNNFLPIIPRKLRNLSRNLMVSNVPDTAKEALSKVYKSMITLNKLDERVFEQQESGADEVKPVEDKEEEENIEEIVENPQTHNLTKNDNNIEIMLNDLREEEIQFEKDLQSKIEQNQGSIKLLKESDESVDDSDVICISSEQIQNQAQAEKKDKQEQFSIQINDESRFIENADIIDLDDDDEGEEEKSDKDEMKNALTKEENEFLNKVMESLSNESSSPNKDNLNFDLIIENTLSKSIKIDLNNSEVEEDTSEIVEEVRESESLEPFLIFCPKNKAIIDEQLIKQNKENGEFINSEEMEKESAEKSPNTKSTTKNNEYIRRFPFLDVSSRREQLKTPKEYVNLVGVKEMLKTPAPEKKQNLVGIKEKLLTPKVFNENLIGVKELFATPQVKNVGIRKMLKGPKQIYQDVEGLKEIFKTPAPAEMQPKRTFSYEVGENKSETILEEKENETVVVEKEVFCIWEEAERDSWKKSIFAETTKEITKNQDRTVKIEPLIMDSGPTVRGTTGNPIVHFSPVRVPIPKPQLNSHNPHLSLSLVLFLICFSSFIVEHDQELCQWKSLIEKVGGLDEALYSSRTTYILHCNKGHGVVTQTIRNRKRYVATSQLNNVNLKKQVTYPWETFNLAILSSLGVQKTTARPLIAVSEFELKERQRIRKMTTAFIRKPDNSPVQPNNKISTVLPNELFTNTINYVSPLQCLTRREYVGNSYVGNS